jgi:phosphotransferase system enzyme I (PtsI)
VNSLADTVRPDFSMFDGIGLVRTEFAVVGTGAFPEIERQYRDYLRIAATMPGKRVCFRLFDIEPDKQAFPGNRVFGARFLLEHPGILEDQLAALLMTAVGHDIDVLVPMVETGEDMSQVALHLAICRERIADLAGNQPVSVRLGAMIESRRAASAFPTFPHVDFVSIGSNDIAADLFGRARDDSGYDVTDFLHPAFVDIVRKVLETASARRIEVSLCGAAADDPAAATRAAAVGIRRFIPSVHAAFTIYPSLFTESTGTGNTLD